VTNYFVRDENRVRKAFGGGFRKERRRELYKDLDEPEQEVKASVRGPTKQLINFLDI